MFNAHFVLFDADSALRGDVDMDNGMVHRFVEAFQSGGSARDGTECIIAKSTDDTNKESRDEEELFGVVGGLSDHCRSTRRCLVCLHDGGHDSSVCGWHWIGVRHWCGWWYRARNCTGVEDGLRM